jgi:hypothetical protein
MVKAPSAYTPVARVIARVLSDAKTQAEYERLPEEERKRTSQLAWKVISALNRYEIRKERIARAGAAK